MNDPRELFPADLLAEFLERGETEGPRARLALMPAAQREEAVACGSPRCIDRATNLSALRYPAARGRERQRGRFLCDEHAARFADRHGIDLASVQPPEEDPP